MSSATDCTQALVVTELGNTRKESEIRPKIDTILDLVKEPNPIHG